ncbi:MAG TPA: HEAT repeat domain-containing protein, partial [Planctomycetaceae bacterium]|nr:HEAT repeat domain-containing protein [Planctomycetaceae bacterium]
VRALTLLTQHGPKPEVQLLTAAATDPDPKVRQFAVLLLGDHATPEVAAVLAKLLDDKSPVVQRRACEAYVRSGLAPPFAATFRLLSAGDRWLRFAARLALEHGPIDKWSAELRSIGQSPAGISNPDAQLLLYRISGDPGVAQTVMAGVSQTLKQARPGSRQWLDALRLAELWLTRSHDADGARASIGSLLLSRFRDESVPKPNSMEDAIRTETARLLAYMQVPEAAAALIQAIDKSPTPQHKIHYAMCLRFLKSGWTLDLKRRYLDWYETTRDMEGGNSLQGYLRNIVTGTLEYYTPQERKQLILAWKERPHSTRLLLSASQPEQVQDFEQVVAKLMAELEQPAAGSHELLGLSIEALSKSASPASQAILRKLFDENADRRDMLARALAQHPIADNVPYLERAVASADKTTMQVCVAALGSADYKPAKPEEIRSAIQAGLKLGNEGGKAVVELLQKWTGSEHQKKDDIASALAHYQQWFRDKYPDEPPPELAREDVEKTKYTVGQLVEFLDKDAKASQGDTARGREVFAKANCLKCHRFLNEGEGVGPDLTAVRRRFQKKEILEAVLLPSQVISDQYAAMTVVTTDGLVHTGLPLPNPGSNKLLLLLSDATKIEISPEKIEEKQKAKVSVMPEGLFKDLSLEQIADLFAFLETSKNNPEPAAATAGAGSSK